MGLNEDFSKYMDIVEGLGAIKRRRGGEDEKVVRMTPGGPSKMERKGTAPYDVPGQTSVATKGGEIVRATPSGNIIKPQIVSMSVPTRKYEDPFATAAYGPSPEQGTERRELATVVTDHPAWDDQDAFIACFKMFPQQFWPKPTMFSQRETVLAKREVIGYKTVKSREIDEEGNAVIVEREVPVYGAPVKEKEDIRVDVVRRELLDTRRKDRWKDRLPESHPMRTVARHAGAEEPEKGPTSPLMKQYQIAVVPFRVRDKFPLSSRDIHDMFGWRQWYAAGNGYVARVFLSGDNPPKFDAEILREVELPKDRSWGPSED